MISLIKKFMSAATPLSEAERALKDWGISYEKQKDGTIIVPGDIDLSWKGLAELPDLSKVIVSGDFWCRFNRLTSLAGAPASVSSQFRCEGNSALKNLEYAPQKFNKLYSDFGEFDSWDEVPEDLKISPETKALQLEEKVRQQEEMIRGVTIIKNTFQALKPLRFNKK